MILYGRNLSPFVRRIAIWCALQDREVERRELMVTGDDFEVVKQKNPVARVPVLELQDGTQLIETFAICDWLEDTATEGKRLLPETGAPRRDALQRLAVANSTAEKAVALVYDRNRRPEQFHWKDWQDRLAGQIKGGIAAMEANAPAEGWHGGDAPDGSDAAIVSTYQFVEATNDWLLEPACPRLAAFCERAMDSAAFAASKPQA